MVMLFTTKFNIQISTFCLQSVFLCYLYLNFRLVLNALFDKMRASFWQLKSKWLREKHSVATSRLWSISGRNAKRRFENAGAVAGTRDLQPSVRKQEACDVVSKTKIDLNYS